MDKLFAWETELPKPDLEACKLLQFGIDRVAVEMAAKQEARSGLTLTQREALWRRPCLGVVLASGELSPTLIPIEGKPKKEWPWVVDPLTPGDVVFVNPQDGKLIEGFEIGGYRDKEEVRLYGISSPWLGAAYPVPIDESILGFWDPMTRTARAFRRRILLKLGDKNEKSQGGLWLPDWLKTRTDEAEIVSAGGQVVEFNQVGRKVTFNRRALHEIHQEDGVVYAFILEDGVYAYTDEKVAA